MRDPGTVRWPVTWLVVGVGAVVFVGCASETRLRHQFTGETAVCRGSPFSAAHLRCLEHHEREGYRRVPE